MFPVCRMYKRMPVGQGQMRPNFVSMSPANINTRSANRLIPSPPSEKKNAQGPEQGVV